MSVEIGTAPEAGEDDAIPAWEIALAEVGQRFGGLDDDDWPSPLSAAVTVFMRHLFDVDAGLALWSAGDVDAPMASLAGGVEGWLLRMAGANLTELEGFLSDELEVLLFVKERWGPVFEWMIEPHVRQETTWHDRAWPSTSKDEVALFGEYLSKDPDVVPALIAAVALGVPVARNHEGANQFQRRWDQTDRLLREYFERRDRRSYCDVVHDTASACFSPGFRFVAQRLLDVASRTLWLLEAAARARALEVAALRREHANFLSGERADLVALRRENEKAVAAARDEGMAASAERVRLLETRIRELEGQVDTVRRRASRENAWLARQRAELTSDEPAKPAPVARPGSGAGAAASDEGPATRAALRAIVTPAEMSPKRPLAGRRVFLYTNKKRGGAREAFFAELVALGAADPRVYETKGASVPGPVAFPPNSVVMVDTSFMSHTFSNVIRRRARASHETLFLEDRFGVGGLAQRLASASERQAGRRGETDIG